MNLICLISLFFLTSLPSYADTRIEFFKSDCAKGDEFSCSYAGKILMKSGKFQEARGPLAYACKKNDKQSCKLFEELQDIEARTRLAENHFNSSCSKHPIDCDLIGEEYFKKGKQIEGLFFFKKSCEASNIDACYRFARFGSISEDNVGYMSLKKSCEAKNTRGCSLLSEFLLYKEEMHDPEKYFQKKCNKGFKIFCESLEKMKALSKSRK